MSDQKSSLGCLLIFLSLLVPLLILYWLAEIFFIPRKGESEMSRGKKYTNIFGMVVLACIIALILFKGGVDQWYRQKAKVDSQSTLDHTAEAFATRDDQEIHRWASGEITDAWGNAPVLHMNNSDGIQFYSKGPDGKLGTEDDLKSRIFHRKPLELPESLLKPLPQDRSEPKDASDTLPQRVKKGFDKAKEGLDEAKQKLDSLRESEKGWKFRFFWNKDEKDE